MTTPGGIAELTATVKRHLGILQRVLQEDGAAFRSLFASSVLLDAQVGTSYLETPPADLRFLPFAVLFLRNGQDQDLVVEYQASPDSLDWYTVRQEVVGAGQERVAVLSADRYPFVRLRTRSLVPPSSGSVRAVVAMHST